MVVWWFVFGMPFAASTIEWVILSSRRRDQFRHITVIMAMVFTTAPASLGIWSLLHFQGMLLVPAGTGHRVIFTGCLLATLGGFAALTWVIRRTKLAFVDSARQFRLDVPCLDVDDAIFRLIDTFLAMTNSYQEQAIALIPCSPRSTHNPQANKNGQPRKAALLLQIISRPS